MFLQIRLSKHKLTDLYTYYSLSKMMSDRTNMELWYYLITSIKWNVLERSWTLNGWNVAFQSVTAGSQPLQWWHPHAHQGLAPAGGAPGYHSTTKTLGIPSPSSARAEWGHLRWKHESNYTWPVRVKKWWQRSALKYRGVFSGFYTSHIPVL